MVPATLSNVFSTNLNPLFIAAKYFSPSWTVTNKEIRVKKNTPIPNAANSPIVGINNKNPNIVVIILIINIPVISMIDNNLQETCFKQVSRLISLSFIY